MASQKAKFDALRDLLDGASAIGHLARDEKAFREAFEAFRGGEGREFQAVLNRVGLEPRCSLVCEWIRMKECIFLCLELCGIPKLVDQAPQPRALAEAIVRITSNEKLVHELVEVLERRNRDAFQRIVNEYKLGPLCHLFCHWLCVVRYRLICRWICNPQLTGRPNIAQELQSAGEALRALLGHKDSFDQAVAASNAGDAAKLGSVINGAGLILRCHLVCEWFCSWRCTWVCFTFCREFPIEPIKDPIKEALAFARATEQLTQKPDQAQRLITALRADDSKSWAGLLQELELRPYCIQLCHWVCGLQCREFCFLVCPPPELDPWFTMVGYFDIYSDIDATGKTNKGLPPASLAHHGGPNFAFTGALQLGGFCPTTSPVFATVAMKYRFLYDLGSGPLPITGNLVSPVEAGTRLINWPQNLAGIAGAALVPTFQTVTIQSAPTPADPIPPAPGAPWVGPSAHYIQPDGAGWVAVDQNAIGGGFQTLLGFDTSQPQVVPGGDPLPGVLAGTDVPAGNKRAGTDLAIIFQATRVTTLPPGTTPDYTNSLNKIHINNWVEVNKLNFAEFVTGCCTPIDKTLSVQFTVDHEEMSSGGWSLGISSCSPSAPGDITPTVSGPGVTVSARGGFGTIVEDTSKWTNCSYTVTLATRPGLTTGLVDRGSTNNSLTFSICGH